MGEVPKAPGRDQCYRRTRPNYRQRSAALGLTPLQLREFMLDSNVQTPATGEAVFNYNDYTTTFYSILEGTVQIQITRKTRRSSSPCRANSSGK